MAQVRRTQEERSAATQRRLLDATIDCLIDLGYAATSTTVIAERAGVSRGAQLHHYPTKAELVAAAVEHLAGRMAEEIQAELSRLPPGGDRVSAAVDLLWSRFNTPLFPAWLELTVASRTDPELRTSLQAVEERLRRAVQRQSEEVFGAEAASSPGFGLAINMTLHLMYGLALDRVLAPADVRARRRRDQQMLAAWKQLLPDILSR